MADAVRHLTLGLALALAATGWGYIGHGQPTLRRLAWGLGSGLVALSCAVAMLGWAGALYPWILRGLAFAPLAYPGRLARVWRLWQAGWKDWMADPAIDRWSARLVGVFVLVAAGGALLPNTHYDVEVYHYTLPRLYLEHHRIYWTRTTSFDGSFQLVHLLYVLAMGIDGEIQANLLGPLFLVLLALATAAATPGRPGGRLAALLLVSSPVVFEQGLGGLVDVPCAAFAMLAVDGWRVAGRSARLRPFGWLFSAAMVGTRSTAGLAAIVLSVMTAARGRPRRAMVFALLSLSLAAPWLLRNVVATGDPFYPILTWGHVVRHGHLPWLLPGPTGPEWQDAFNPLLLGGLCLYWAQPRDPRQRPLWAGGVSLLALDLLFHLSDLRYMLPALAWLAPLAGTALACWAARPLRAAGAAACGVALLAAAIQSGARLESLGDPQAFLLRHDPVEAAWVWLQSCPEPGTILLTNRRGLRCPRPFVVGEPGAMPDPALFYSDVPAWVAHRDIHFILWDLGTDAIRQAVLRWELRNQPAGGSTWDRVSHLGLLACFGDDLLRQTLLEAGVPGCGQPCPPSPGRLTLPEHLVGLHDRSHYNHLMWGYLQVSGPVLYAHDGIVVVRVVNRAGGDRPPAAQTDSAPGGR